MFYGDVQNARAPLHNIRQRFGIIVLQPQIDTETGPQWRR